MENYFVFIDGVQRRGARALDLAMTATIGGVAAKAIRAGKLPPDLPANDEEAAVQDIIATLELHEWNIARVARVKGVTRKTVYDWMKKYEIPRRRVKRS
jgi:transcriptional regulator of acetoin/glycerol metabolism